MVYHLSTIHVPVLSDGVSGPFVEKILVFMFSLEWFWTLHIVTLRDKIPTTIILYYPHCSLGSDYRWHRRALLVIGYFISFSFDISDCKQEDGLSCLSLEVGKRVNWGKVIQTTEHRTAHSWWNTRTYAKHWWAFPRVHSEKSWLPCMQQGGHHKWSWVWQRANKSPHNLQWPWL